MRLSTPLGPVGRWAEYRRRQREVLRGATGAHHESDPPAPEPTPAPAFGVAGVPLSRHSPFYLGFYGALGALVAIGLWTALGQLTTVLTILLISFFLTLALNPIVEALTARGLRRGLAVLVVFIGATVVFVLLGMLVIPPVVTQGTDLAGQVPGYVQHVLDSGWVRRLDRNYHVVDKIQQELTNKATDQTFISQVLGGIFGVGRVVLNGVFQAFTILVLTLYFLGSLPRMKRAAYAVVPASRRERVESLSEAIMRRTGSYAVGQVAVASVNGFMSWVMMMIVGIPYAAVLAVAVGFLGLVPMVGATLGAIVVATVAFFDDPTKAIIAIVYYIVYQQVENYVVMPRIMSSTIAVPGAVTVVAALTGGTLLGVLGALIAIPVAAGLLLLYDEVLLPRQERA